jgi:hypothetical protein
MDSLHKIEKSIVIHDSRFGKFKYNDFFENDIQLEDDNLFISGVVHKITKIYDFLNAGFNYTLKLQPNTYETLQNIINVMISKLVDFRHSADFFLDSRISFLEDNEIQFFVKTNYVSGFENLLLIPDAKYTDEQLDSIPLDKTYMLQDTSKKFNTIGDMYFLFSKLIDRKVNLQFQINYMTSLDNKTQSKSNIYLHPRVSKCFRSPIISELRFDTLTISEPIICPICFCDISDTDEQFVSLSCDARHSVCFECYNVCKSKNLKKCPICRKDIKYTDGKIIQFKSPMIDETEGSETPDLI